MADEPDDGRRYTVVINDEEQYSIWLADRPVPPGWREAGKQGLRAECLDYIAEAWTDMRPLSLRRAMDGAGAGRPAPGNAPGQTPAS